jgi:hypothetical protein
MNEKDNINNIEKDIDNFISKEKIFNYSRNLMTLDVLRYLELITFFDKEKQDWPNIGYHKTSDNLRGINYSIDWIYKYADEIDNFDFRFHKKNLSNVKRIFLYSTNYSVLSDWFFYSRKKILKFSYNKSEKKIILNQTDKKIELFKILNECISNHHVEKNILDKLNSEKNKKNINNIFEILKKIKKTGNSNFFSLDYRMPEIKNVYKFIFNSDADLTHDYNKDWNLGGYTVDEFRRVFTAIKSIALIHNMFLYSIYITKKDDINKEKFFQNLVSFKSEKKWIKLLKFFTNIEDKVIKNIIYELVYDFSQVKHKNKVGVTSYCFYPVGDNILALSNVIARSSYAERNIWLMLARNNKNIHSKLSILKESYWKKMLIEKLTKKGIWCFNQTIKIDHSDIDLLLIDFKNNFGLSIELKWLTQSNRPIDYELVDKELSKGQKQAFLCEKWINNNKKELADKINLNVDKILKINFKSIVLSKNSIGSPRVNNNYIPITTKDLFWWILDSPLKQNIKNLYKIVNKKNFYPKVGQHYTKGDTCINYAGYTFIRKNIYFSNNKWSHLKNIL